MAGLQAIERARTTPVVLLTADSRVIKSQLAGYAAVLKKPINLEKLFELVRRYA